MKHSRLKRFVLFAYLWIPALFIPSAAKEPASKSSSVLSLTPDPIHYSVKQGKIIEQKSNQAIFFKGIGYSPYLPGETPLKGKSPGNDARYQQHMELIKNMGVNYLHVFPMKMPTNFFSQLDQTDIVYSQDIWMFPNTTDFLAEEYLAWKWKTIKSVIDHTYQIGRPDRLLFFSIGDELKAKAVTRTDNLHPNVTEFIGKHIKVTNRTATEVAVAKLIDRAIEYELQTYGQRHLYCHTSWTHIGPLPRPDLEVPIKSALMPDIGDLVCLNIYTYARGVVTSTPGSKTGTTFQGYLEQLAKQTAKPIMITQVGLSTSPFEPKPNVPGFGGHAVKKVPQAFKQIWKDVHTAEGHEKYNGIAFFEFQDEWWKSGEDPTDSSRHNAEDPEEWFGVFQLNEKHQLIPKGDIPSAISQIYHQPSELK